MAANSYIAVSDVIAGLGNQVYNLLGVAVGSDISANTALLAAIAQVNAEIDSYLRTRYDLPLPFVSADLVANALNLVLWRLVIRRPEVASEGDRSLFEDAQKYFDRLMTGKALLDQGTPEGTSEAGFASVVTIGEDNTALPANQDWIGSY